MADAATPHRTSQAGQRNIGERGWVRFPKEVLNPFALEILRRGLLAPKGNAAAGPRPDTHKLTFTEGGLEFVRVPVSYLVRLALADAVGGTNVHPVVHRTGVRLLDHFLRDSPSPGTHSFYIVHGASAKGPESGPARETGRPFLLTQLLVMYANDKFQLAPSGQKATMCLSPHSPALRRYQRYLRVCDSRYRTAILRWPWAEAVDPVELFGMKGTTEDLLQRRDGGSECPAAAGLTRDIADGPAGRSLPDVCGGEAFKSPAEESCGNSPRLRRMSEALDLLEDDLSRLASPSSPHHATLGRLLYGLVLGETVGYLRGIRDAVMTERASVDDLRRLICAVLLTIGADRSCVPEPAPL
ncbi:MAG: hypothetical protein ABSC19_18560 [Syntrophorhabdales bacterium]|jgi:hypothetical protein